MGHQAALLALLASFTSTTAWVLRSGPRSCSASRRSGRQQSVIDRPATRCASAAMGALATAGMEAEVTADVPGWGWRDGTGRATTFDQIVDHIRVTDIRRENVEVHVACDSAVQGSGSVTFAVAICVISVGHAGRYFFTRISQPLYLTPVLQTRLLREVQLSLDAAQELTERDVCVARVHCDSNTAPGCGSTEHTKMLCGYIQAMGFRYFVKPQAWATLVADRHSRGARYA